jgi:hypothetical protein
MPAYARNKTENMTDFMRDDASKSKDPEAIRRQDQNQN